MILVLIADQNRDCCIVLKSAEDTLLGTSRIENTEEHNLVCFFAVQHGMTHLPHACFAHACTLWSLYLHRTDVLAVQSAQDQQHQYDVGLHEADVVSLTLAPVFMQVPLPLFPCFSLMQPWSKARCMTWQTRPL